MMRGVHVYAQKRGHCKISLETHCLGSIRAPMVASSSTLFVLAPFTEMSSYIGGLKGTGPASVNDCKDFLQHIRQQDLDAMAGKVLLQHATLQTGELLTIPSGYLVGERTVTQCASGVQVTFARPTRDEAKALDSLRVLFPSGSAAVQHVARLLAETVAAMRSTGNCGVTDDAIAHAPPCSEPVTDAHASGVEESSRDDMNEPGKEECKESSRDDMKEPCKSGDGNEQQSNIQVDGESGIADIAEADPS